MGPYPLIKLQRNHFFMQSNFFRKAIFDEKSRSLLIQTLVIGLFAIFIYLIAQQTAYNLEKRGIGTGFEFLNIAAGYDISISLIPYDSLSTIMHFLVVDTWLVCPCR